MARLSAAALEGLSGEMGKDAGVIPVGEGNESTPMEQRVVTKVDARTLDAGAKVGERGEYHAATYRTGRGNVRQDR
jgi:hypothetical protein